MAEASEVGFILSSSRSRPAARGICCAILVRSVVPAILAILALFSVCSSASLAELLTGEVGGYLATGEHRRGYEFRRVELAVSAIAHGAVKLVEDAISQLTGFITLVLNLLDSIHQFLDVATSDSIPQFLDQAAIVHEIVAERFNELLGVLDAFVESFTSWVLLSFEIGVGLVHHLVHPVYSRIIGNVQCPWANLAEALAGEVSG